MAKSYASEDESCGSSSYMIAKGKLTKDKKKSSHKSCKNYKVNDTCKLPDSVFYYADDSQNNVPASEYKQYNYDNITSKLEKIKKSKDLNQKRCDCDYMVSLNWASKDGTSLWDRYKKYGFWKKGEGVNDYLENSGVSEKTKYEIMKLLCDATNTTNPRPESQKSAKSIFDNEKILQIINIIMGLISVIIIIMATGTYKEYIGKLSGNKSLWGIFNIIILLLAIGLSIVEFTNIDSNIFGNIIIYGFSIFIILLIILSIVSKDTFRSVSVFYIAFLIGIQLWLSLPLSSIFGDHKNTSGVLEFLAIMIEKTGLINKGVASLFGNSIKTTSGSKWNVPFVPATIMLINWILGVNMTASDLTESYTKKMRKIKSRNANSFQINATIGDIGF